MGILPLPPTQAVSKKVRQPVFLYIFVFGKSFGTFVRMLPWDKEKHWLQHIAYVWLGAMLQQKDNVCNVMNVCHKNKWVMMMMMMMMMVIILLSELVHF
jgi:hypothetical protein